MYLDPQKYPRKWDILEEKRAGKYLYYLVLMCLRYKLRPLYRYRLKKEPSTEPPGVHRVFLSVDRVGLARTPSRLVQTEVRDARPVSARTLTGPLGRVWDLLATTKTRGPNPQNCYWS